MIDKNIPNKETMEVVDKSLHGEDMIGPFETVDEMFECLETQKSSDNQNRKVVI